MFPVCPASGRGQPSWLQLCFQHIKLDIILRTSEKSGLRCLNSRLNEKKSALKLFFYLPVSRTLLAHPPGHCPPLVLQAAWWLVRLLIPIFTWLSDRVGLLPPHLTGSALALPAIQIRTCCFVRHWNRADFLKKLTAHLQSEVSGFNLHFFPIGLSIESWRELWGAGFSWKSTFNYGCSASKPGWQEDDSRQHYLSNFGSS